MNLHKDPLTQKLPIIPGLVRYPAHTPRPGSAHAGPITLLPPPSASAPEAPLPKPASVPPPSSSNGVARPGSVRPPSMPSPSKKPRKSREVYTAAQKANALSLVAGGLTQTEAAKRLGIGSSAISNWTQGKGLKSPKPKPQKAQKTAPRAQRAAPAPVTRAKTLPPPGPARSGGGGSSGGNPLARLDALFAEMQTSLEAQTRAMREVDEIRKALRMVFGG